MYIDILKVLNENSVYDDENIAVIEARSFHKLAEELNDLFALRGASRSIGKDTKPTLRTMTPKQIAKEIGVCSLCIYHKNHKESEDCRKCINENEPNQYYG